MKRFFLIVSGIVVMLVGLAAGAAGGSIIGVVGSDGRYDTAVGSTLSQGYALVFNEFEVSGTGQDSLRKFAEITVGARSLNGNELFMGVAPATSVADYLAGVPHDVVTDVSSGKTVSIPGNTAPAPPEDKQFWMTQGSGLDPVINLATDPRKLTLVIMNRDARMDVAAEVKVGIFSGSIFSIGIGLIAFGLLVLVLAIWMFVRAAKAKKKPPLPPTAPPLQGSEIGYAPPLTYAGHGQGGAQGWPTPPQAPPPPGASPSAPGGYPAYPPVRDPR